MPTHKERKWVHHSADQMLDLVVSVDQYPEFLPWCTDARITSKEVEGEKEVIVADLDVAFTIFRETFSSRVNTDRGARRIDIDYLNGPFCHLANHWIFEQNEDGTCTIDFFIEFEFRSRALKIAVSAIFHEAARRMVNAFAARADALYGTAQ
jgi:coenzyme Q-binding protein COQ10